MYFFFFCSPVDPRVSSKPDKSKEATKDDILRKTKKNIIKKKYSQEVVATEPLLPYEDDEEGDDLRDQLSRRRAERAQVGHCRSCDPKIVGSNPCVVEFCFFFIFCNISFAYFNFKVDIFFYCCPKLTTIIPTLFCSKLTTFI